MPASARPEPGLAANRQDDIVTRIVDWGVERRLWSAETGRLIDEQLRFEFGGEDDLYVPRVAWRAKAARDQAILAAVAAGRTYTQVAEEFDCSRSKVFRVVKAARGRTVPRCPAFP